MKHTSIITISILSLALLGILIVPARSHAAGISNCPAGYVCNPVVFTNCPTGYVCRLKSPTSAGTQAYVPGTWTSTYLSQQSSNGRTNATAAANTYGPITGNYLC